MSKLPLPQHWCSITYYELDVKVETSEHGTVIVVEVLYCILRSNAWIVDVLDRRYLFCSYTLSLAIVVPTDYIRYRLVGAKERFREP